MRDGLVGAPTEQPLAFGYRALERFVLQPVQGVVMHERRHRTLTGQEVTPVFEYVGEVGALVPVRRRRFGGDRVHRRRVNR
jgi:hypothetical protein